MARGGGAPVYTGVDMLCHGWLGAYKCRPGWHRRQPSRALSASLCLLLRATGLVWQAALVRLTMFKKRLKPLPQSVAMGSDPSPATPDSATARSAEGHSSHSSANAR